MTKKILLMLILFTAIVFNTCSLSEDIRYETFYKYENQLLASEKPLIVERRIADEVFNISENKYRISKYCIRIFKDC